MERRVAAKLAAAVVDYSRVPLGRQGGGGEDRLGGPWRAVAVVSHIQAMDDWIGTKTSEADAAAFPDRIGGNPNSSVVMMAEKAVDMFTGNRSECE